MYDESLSIKDLSSGVNVEVDKWRGSENGDQHSALGNTSVGW
jgi:hypothetical protein